jgi:membrane-associated protease RseP (regulator of RpoE activity)
MCSDERRRADDLDLRFTPDDRQNWYLGGRPVDACDWKSLTTLGGWQQLIDRLWFVVTGRDAYSADSRRQIDAPKIEQVSPAAEPTQTTTQPPASPPESRATHGWIGVQITTVTPEIAKDLGLQQSKGALVTDVNAGGPAATAGIEPHDVITRIDDEVVDEPDDLAKAISAMRPGATVRLVVVRQQAEKTVTVKLRARPQ